MKIRVPITLSLVITILLMAPACNEKTESFFSTGEYRFLSPEKPIATPEFPEINWIVENMGDLDKSATPYPNAERPGQDDWTYSEEDYTIGPGDILEVSILDLYAEGLETILRREVAASGFIDLPQLDNRVRAQGLTGSGLINEIKKAYAPDILRRPVVSVNIIARRRRTFSMLGSVLRPGTYDITRPDIRLLDALALSGGVSQNNIEYAYIIRQAPALKKAVEGERADEGTAGKEGPSSGKDAKAKPAKYDYDPVKGEWVPVTATRPATKTTNGTKAPAAPKPLKKPAADDPYGWNQYSKTGLSRVIAIDLERLRRGDYRMNIVVRENDIIHVPQLEIGEFYVMGEVLRPGVYSLTGRKITVKMALAAAGNLGPLAWPKNSVLVRRIGDNQEQAVPIDIENIIRGDDPDVFLKPNDIIAVGTHWSSPFLAVLRNSFRMTYGFGFIYDRNFADPMIYGTPDSKRFKGL